MRSTATRAVQSSVVDDDDDDDDDDDARRRAIERRAIDMSARTGANTDAMDGGAATTTAPSAAAAAGTNFSSRILGLKVGDGSRRHDDGCRERRARRVSFSFVCFASMRGLTRGCRRTRA